jgi:hypothetical protein
MSFNRRGGPDRRPDRPERDRYDRPPRREGGGQDWQQRDRRPPPSGGGGGGRPYQPRPRYDRPPDEGAMSIRLDPRRVGTLKQLAAEANTRPGDLVRHWVEERIDAARSGVPTPEAASSLADRLDALVARVAALEAALGAGDGTPGDGDGALGAGVEPPAAEVAIAVEAPESPRVAAAKEARLDDTDTPKTAAPKRHTRKRVSAKPKAERVSLHDEMIAVLVERGPMTAGDLAAAVAERGRYAPPRSGKPLDAAMVSQRVSNPTYRARFTRSDGRIGLAEVSE